MLLCVVCIATFRDLKRREHYKGNSQKFELPENASKEAQSQTVFVTLGSLAKRNSQTSTRKAQK